MVARQTLVRNGSRTQSEGRAYVGVYKGAAKDRIKAGAPYPGRCGSPDPVGPSVRSGRRGGSPNRITLSFACSRSLSAPLAVATFSKAQKVRVGLHQPPVVLLGGFHDTLPRGSPSAEGGHKRPVLAAQHHYVRVRLVQVVVELGEQWLILHALSSQPRRQWLPAVNAL